MIKNYFRILKNPHAYLQAILKAHVKFQKDQPKTVGEVKGTRYLLPIHFCNFRIQKMSKFKMCIVCVEVLRPSQPNGVMSSAVSLPNHTFTGQA